MKESELESLTATVIALDGLAVIVNKENPIDNITSEEVRRIFTGEIVSWDEISK